MSQSFRSPVRSGLPLTLNRFLEKKVENVGVERCAILDINFSAIENLTEIAYLIVKLHHQLMESIAATG